MRTRNCWFSFAYRIVVQTRVYILRVGSFIGSKILCKHYTRAINMYKIHFLFNANNGKWYSSGCYKPMHAISGNGRRQWRTRSFSYVVYVALVYFLTNLNYLPKYMVQPFLIFKRLLGWPRISPYDNVHKNRTLDPIELNSILSRVSETKDGDRIGNRMYWPLTGCNYS